MANINLIFFDAVTRSLVVGVLAAMVQYDLGETMPASSMALVETETGAEGENDQVGLTEETARHPTEPYQSSMGLL